MSNSNQGVSIFKQRVTRTRQVIELLKPYGLEPRSQGFIFDTKLPLSGGFISGLSVDDIVICDSTEFLDKNPILNIHLNQKRHEITELFQTEQAEARAWSNRPIESTL